MTKDTILNQGAEGKLYLSEYGGKKCLVKERFTKKYRHPELDKQLTKQRIKAEQKAVERCNAAGVLTPKFYNVDLNERKIYMEYFGKSITAKDRIETLSNESDGYPKIQELAEKIGEVIGKLHANHIIHGDLTTSNILLDPTDDGDNRTIMIDFGLSQYSESAENKGVDLYVLERALLSTHSQIPDLFNLILKSYRLNNPHKCSEVIAKFEAVRARGRKRTMVG